MYDLQGAMACKLTEQTEQASKLTVVCLLVEPVLAVVLLLVLCLVLLPVVEPVLAVLVVGEGSQPPEPRALFAPLWW